MALRPKHIYNRLNRARLDSSAFRIHRQELIQLYRELKGCHTNWLKGALPTALTAAAQAFVDFLSMTFLVPPIALSLVDRARPHGRDEKGRVRGELYGSCTYHGNIRIYLRTAARGQRTAFKTFFNTLVHEWVHHYDFEALGDTIHCAGFYQRIQVLYGGCLEGDEKKSLEESC